MDFKEALNQLKTLADQGIIKFSENSIISDGVLFNKNSEEAQTILSNLLNDKKITYDIYKCLNDKIKSYTLVIYEDKEVEKYILGTKKGILLGLLLGPLGLIICLFLGDNKAKKASIISSLIELVVIVIGIIILVSIK